MTIADRIYEIVQTLPEEQAAKVLDFVKSVQAKPKDTAVEPVSEKMSHDEKMTAWHNLLSSLSGAWKDDDFPSLEEIRAGEGEDVPREIW